MELPEWASETPVEGTADKRSDKQRSGAIYVPLPSPPFESRNNFGFILLLYHLLAAARRNVSRL